MEAVKSKNLLESAKGETPGVDFCVMLDCTGSMGGYIAMSKNKVKDIMAQLKEAYPNSEIRISIVAYRDIQDPKRFELQQFTDSSDEAKSFLNKLQAQGGGDCPEDINGAFQKALFSLEWKNPVRLLVLVADAPCHGKIFHKEHDDHPNGHKSDMDWEKIFQKLVDLRLDFLFLKISVITDQMFNLFLDMAKKKGIEGYELSFQQELIRDANSEDKSKKDPKKVSHEEHFAAKICEKVKASVDKELKKGFKNKLEKRTTENSDLVENIKKSIAKTVEKIDFAELKKKYGDLSAKIGECILSSNNFIEALADEDCLCLTFNIGRSQAAIVDPSQIIIKDVFPSFLTAGSFFYSTEFALKKNKLAHGGYEKNAEGLIIKGAAQEDITGVMPLYLCEENWEVAKQLMKMTIAWDVTLEPSGYAYNQIKTVPFLILAKIAQMLHEKPDSQFLAFQFELVKQTCVQIMRDGSLKKFEHKFDEEVIELYNKYIDHTNLRTIDSIANNTVYLAQLYIVKECGLSLPQGVLYFDNFIKLLLEEELRRKSFPLDEVVNINQWILDLLKVDVKTLIEDPVEEFKKTNAPKDKGVSMYAQTFLLTLELHQKDYKEKLAKNKLEEMEKKTELEETKQENSIDMVEGKPKELEKSEIKGNEYEILEKIEVKTKVVEKTSEDKGIENEIIEVKTKPLEKILDREVEGIEHEKEEKIDKIDESKEPIKTLEVKGIEHKEEKKYEEIKSEEAKFEKIEKKELNVNIHNFRRGNNQYSDIQKKAIDELVKVFKKVIGYVYPLAKLIKGKEVEHPDKLLTWGINNDSKLFTLYIQNKLQTKNSERREAFEKKQHMNPWTQDIEYIQHWYDKSIEDEKKIRIGNFLAEMRNKDSGDKAKIFAYSEDLYEAAGALLGVHVGTVEFKSFLDELCLGKAVFIREKAKILKGNYLGVKIYSDIDYWRISKKKANRLWKAYEFKETRSLI